MGNFVFMKVIDGLDHLSEEHSGVIFAEATGLIETVEQFPTLAETR